MEFYARGRQLRHLRLRWRVWGQPPPGLASALDKSLLGTSGRGNTSSWAGKTCSVGSSRTHSLSRQPPASSVCEVRSPGFGDSSKGSELETDSTRPSPQLGILVAPGPAASLGRRGQVVLLLVASHSPRQSLAGLGQLVGTRRGGSTRFSVGVRDTGGVPLSSGTQELAPRGSL